jgi:anti-sigma-K factor RskA
VSGCRSHGQLVGGYVLGALDPEEMERMRLHVADCPRCGPEARALTGLPDLLDRIEPADVPPPALPPGVEEAVLDRFVSERRQAGASRGRRRPALGRRLALAGAGLAALVLALAIAWPFGGDGGEREAYASAELGGLAPAAQAGANAWVAEVPAGTRVRLEARGLPRGGPAEYELWCVRADGRWVSGGTFRAGSDGRAEAELTAAVRPGDYHLMVVTRRAGSAAEGERGTAVLRGRLRY